ncbi:Unconventional myosin-XVIIIa [Frankliniella fusca]|uniref:Unconventional myosin-XVIIIa n=1 Tax=Frankliniella fusca TaxID=407009 RepID=A0AAE1I639_9NEOP|nr:Unconventional myosin-XVIIIa [Frankliniella fusca]
MFNFMKKGPAGPLEREEKEKRKKEKREQKERKDKKRDRSSMTAEELLRLDEVRRSLKLRGRRKEKEKLPSGITADYSASFFGDLERLSPEREGSETDGRRERTASLPLGQSLSSYNPSTMGGSSWGRGADTLTHSDSSEASSNSLNQQPQQSKVQQKVLPPLPPRPPKRGILKQGPRSSTSSLASDGVPTNSENQASVDPNTVLVRNTIQNEVITYQNLPSHSKSTSSFLFREADANSALSVLLTSDNSAASPDFSSEIMSPLSARSADHAPNNYLSVVSSHHEKKLSKASLSPSAESLTDTTTNSSFATPPFSLSPVGESQGFHGFGGRWSKYVSNTFEDMCSELPPPPITPVPLPQPRELTIQRQPPPRSDFGFSLRRAIIVDRVETPQGVTMHSKAVIFAEPGAIIQHNNETGLLPGDRLIEVNGIPVDDKSREEIIGLIKSSGSSVTVKVQPVPELCELTRRSADGALVELDDSNIRGGTLRRSGSRRFKKSAVSSRM